MKTFLHQNRFAQGERRLIAFSFQSAPAPSPDDMQPTLDKLKAEPVAPTLKDNPESAQQAATERVGAADKDVGNYVEQIKSGADPMKEWGEKLAGEGFLKGVNQKFNAPDKKGTETVAQTPVAKSTEKDPNDAIFAEVDENTDASAPTPAAEGAPVTPEAESTVTPASESAPDAYERQGLESIMLKIPEADRKIASDMFNRKLASGTFESFSDLSPSNPEEQRVAAELNKIINSFTSEERQILDEAALYMRNHAAESANQMTPEQRQEQIVNLQGQLKDINTKLSDPNTAPEIAKELAIKKEQLTAELNKLTEGLEGPKKAPETVGEKLEQQMEQALDKLKNAKTSAESFAAIMEIVGTLIQYMQGAFDGTLTDSLTKPTEPEAKDGEKTPEDAKGETEKDLEDRVKEEIAERSKAKPGEKVDETRTTPATLEENAEGLKEEKETEIKEIDTDIEGLDNDIKDLKGKNEALIGQKSEIEKKMNELQGQENMDSEIDSLKTQLEAIQTSIDANTKAIETLDKRRDDLVAKKETLSKEVVAIDKIKTDTESAKTKMAEIMKIVTDIWNEKFPGKKIPTIKIDLDADGDIHLTIEGLDEETKTALPEGTDVVNGKAEIDPETLTSSENAETAESDVDAFGESGNLKEPTFYESLNAANEIRMLLATARKGKAEVGRDELTAGLTKLNEAYAKHKETVGTDSDGFATKFATELNAYLKEANANYTVGYDVGSDTFSLIEKGNNENIKAEKGNMEDIQGVQAIGGNAEMNQDQMMA